MAHHVVWWRWVGAVPVCPPASPCKGASIVHSPCTMRVLVGMETPLRGRSGGHTGTAPTVSFGQIACGWLVSFGWIACGQLVSFGWIACGWLFVCWENGAQEPTPSVLYFCQPWVKSWRGTYAIGIVLFKINLHAGKSFIRYCVMMMRDEKKYNPQGGSLLACIVTQGRLRCTCQPCAIESITPMGLGHTVLFGAIECAIRWGMGTPCGWRGLSNVQCDGVMTHRVV